MTRSRTGKTAKRLLSPLGVPTLIRSIVVSRSLSLSEYSFPQKMTPPATYHAPCQTKMITWCSAVLYHWHSSEQRATNHRTNKAASSSSPPPPSSSISAAKYYHPAAKNDSSSPRHNASLRHQPQKIPIHQTLRQWHPPYQPSSAHHSKWKVCIGENIASGDM